MDVLIRGLSAETVRRLDAEAAAAGLSRNEFLRNRLEGEREPAQPAKLTPADWVRSAEIFVDIDDAAVMAGAWQ